MSLAETFVPKLHLANEELKQKSTAGLWICDREPKGERSSLGFDPSCRFAHNESRLDVNLVWRSRRPVQTVEQTLCGDTTNFGQRLIDSRKPGQSICGRINVVEPDD